MSLNWPLVSRSNALAALTGGLAVAMAVWGKYREWYWYDNLAHLSGGVSLGAAVTSRQSNRFQDLAIVTCLMLGWELFEYRRRIYPHDGTLPKRVAAEDTLLDSVLVLLGAWFAIVTGK